MTDVLEIENLHVSYPGRGLFSKSVEVLHGVDLTIGTGETLGLVGESGSGKTTLGRTVVGLVTPTSGEVRFDGEPLTARTTANRRTRAAEIQVVFQDPYTSLNPALTIGDTLSEPLIAQGETRVRARKRVGELLELVNLPTNSLSRMPHEFSGGQRQRVAIARALAINPRLIVCDEPVSALDLINQARVLDLLIEIQERTGVSYLFISHDLMVVRRISHRVAVLYRGDIVETGPADVVTSQPKHPYTQRLLLSSPVLDPQEQRDRREQRRRLEEIISADAENTEKEESS